MRDELIIMSGNRRYSCGDSRLGCPAERSEANLHQPSQAGVLVRPNHDNLQQNPLQTLPT
jgi:hypothetical protein